MEGDRERERDREGVPAESGTPEAFAQLWADVMGILVSAAPAGGLPRAAPSPKPAGGGGDGGIVRRRRPPYPRQRGDGGCWGGMGATAGSCCLGGGGKKKQISPNLPVCVCGSWHGVLEQRAEGLGARLDLVLRRCKQQAWGENLYGKGLRGLS